MAKIGRNAPCPCGSGKKYKQCCLAANAAYQTMLDEQRDAKIRAVDWLESNYGAAMGAAVAQTFFVQEQGDLGQYLPDMAEGMRMMLLGGLHDWIIAEGVLSLDAGPVPVGELLLGKGGPLFTTTGRRHIEQLAASRLSLYEVLEVHIDKGLMLRDMLREDAPPVFVGEKMATHQLVVWNTLGLRILQDADGGYSLGGGVYPLPRDLALEVSDFIHKEIRRESKKKRSRLSPETITTSSIIAAWLDHVVAPPSIPRFIDQQTKEPIMFTTDLYRVADWEALEARLDAREDVMRDDEDKSIWIRMQWIDEDQGRSLTRLERLPNGLLEMECRTVGKADDARDWLETLAGALVRHTKRETRDPREELAREAASPQRKSAAKKQEDAIPPEIEEELIAKFLRDHYAAWLTMPLPALNGKTPMQAAKLKTWRPKLVELLKSIEITEANRTRDSGFAPFDIGFLWERLGLPRR